MRIEKMIFGFMTISVCHMVSCAGTVCGKGTFTSASMHISGQLDNEPFVPIDGFARKHSNGLISIVFTNQETPCEVHAIKVNAETRYVNVYLNRKYQICGTFTIESEQWWDAGIGATATLWTSTTGDIPKPKTIVAKTGNIVIDTIKTDDVGFVSGKVILSFSNGKVSGDFSVPLCEYASRTTIR